MSWKDASIMELRIQFITDWLKRTHTVSDLCTRYGIRRKSGHKWILAVDKDVLPQSRRQGLVRRSA